MAYPRLDLDTYSFGITLYCGKRDLERNTCVAYPYEMARPLKFHSWIPIPTVWVGDSVRVTVTSEETPCA